MHTRLTTPGGISVPDTSIPRHGSYTTEEDERANELITALTSLPSSDPHRPALRRRTIEAWLPLARRLARRYDRRGEPFDDLLQTATIGLIKAIDGFDPHYGTDFIAYAIPTILGEIKRHFRDRTWSLRIPRRLQEMRMAISRAQTELSHVLNRAPTVADIAVHLEVTEEAVLEGLEGGYAYRAVSLSSPVGSAPAVELGDLLGSREHGYELVDLNVSLPPAMACLTDRERRVVAMRFYGNLTQTRIAEQIGVSQMHVSRILAGALSKLRVRLVDAD